ncbi:hypothetical protein Taro_033117 [Colocasia esculenta]|uniref:Uncharacterized protein n=1 Tax=Colocasia esculenta TaxID=4460 RepID=A0A843WBJ6_COLES|nr:hypothetical protein [Colocasia esculenta]
MEELLEGLNCSLRVSGMIGDSIMVSIVNSAMEEAYERILSSKEGGLECLNDKSRFCGLAIMQLEWCLKYLQEEMDACVVKSDDERERLVGDLRVTRDRLRSRLEETESAIAEKEMELEDMNQSESDLRRALESKDKELRSLRTSLELERARQAGVPEGTTLDDGAGEGMIEEVNVALGELRTFIIQHIEDLSSKLMEAQTHITDLIEKLGICYSSKMEISEATLESTKEEGSSDFSIKNGVSEMECMETDGGKAVQHHEAEQNSDAEILRCTLKTDLDKLFKQLSLEMTILTGRLVLAFETADEAIYLSRADMDEQQLLWTFEKETLNVIVENFLRDVEESCRSMHFGESENIPPAFLDISWSSLMKWFATLCHNLEQLSIQLDGKLETASSIDPASHSEDIAKENSTSHLNHFDYKVERNHESRFSRKTQEATWLRAVEKGFPFFQNSRELCHMKTKLTEIILKLECFMEESSKLHVAFDDLQSVNEMNTFALQDNLSRSESTDKVSAAIYPSTAPRSKEMTLYSVAADVYEETRYLKDDRDDSFLKSIVLEETNAIFFNVFVRELYLEFIDYNLETLFREDLCRLIFNEIMKERNHRIEDCDSERAFNEERDQIVFSDLIKVRNNAAGLGSKKHTEENSSCCTIFFQGPYIGEDIVEVADKISLSFEVEDLLSHPKSEIVEPQMHLVWNSQLASEQSATHTEAVDFDDDDEDNEAFSSVRSKLEKALQQLTMNKLQLRELGSDAEGLLEEKERADDDDDYDDAFSSMGSKLENAPQQLTKNKLQLTELGPDMGGSFGEKEHVNDDNDDDDEAFSSVKSKLEKALQQLTKNKMQLSELETNVGGTLQEKEGSNDGDDDDETFSSVSKLEKALQQLTKNKVQHRDLGSEVGGSFEEKEFADDDDDEEEEEEEAFSSVNSKSEKALQQLTKSNAQFRDLESDMGKSLEGKEHEDDDDDDDDEVFSSVRTKLEKALQQLTKNRMQLKELGSDAGGSLEDKDDVDDKFEQDKEQSSCLHIKNGGEGCNEIQYVLREPGAYVGGLVEEKKYAADKSEQDKEQASYIHIRNREEGCNEIQLAVAHLTDFSRNFVDLELVVYEKTKANHMDDGVFGRLIQDSSDKRCKPLASGLRLEGLNCQLNLLVQQASSLKKAELLFRKAFTRRCYNLQTAEAEVWLAYFL